MALWLSAHKNTAEETGPHLILVYIIYNPNGPIDEKQLAVYKPHVATEMKYTSHVFAMHEDPKSREYGDNDKSDHSLMGLLEQLDNRYGEG